MPQPAFRFQALLQYREHLRDLCRQRLAELLAVDAELAHRKDTAVAARNELLNELRALLTQPRLEVDQAATRRYHAGQLAAEAQRLQHQRDQLAGRIAECRQALVKADQGVKVLEQLADKQRQAAEWEQDRRESREREEIWQAGRLRPFAGP